MGILDFLGGGSPEEKAKKLRPKLAQKYGDAGIRQKAIHQLGEMKHPEAVRSLMTRFTITVDPHSIDADEKDHVFELVKGFGEMAVEPVKEFLQRSDQASSWAVRILEALVPEEQLISICLAELERVGPEYSRDPEKKVVLIHSLAGRKDPRIGPAMAPFLEDPADDVKLAALTVIGAFAPENAREPVMELIASGETARRVRTAAINAAAEAGYGVQGHREKVEAAVADPFFVDGSGQIKKRT